MSKTSAIVLFVTSMILAASLAYRSNTAEELQQLFGGIFFGWAMSSGMRGMIRG